MLLLLASAAFAQDPTPQPEIRFEKVSEVEFVDPLELEGELVKPRINPVFEAMRRGFDPLTRPRLDFDREILESVDQIR